MALLFDQVGLFSQDFHVLFELDFGIELLSGETFLNLKLLEHALGRLVFEFEGELESGDLLALSFELKTLLVGFCNASTLKFVLHFHVLFVNFALF